MLLKTVRTSAFTITLEHSDDTPVAQQVQAIKELFDTAKDKVETFTNIYPPLKIIHSTLLNGMGGVPPDTVAIVQHTVEGRIENIFISEGEEAYLISEDTGATVSVINRKETNSYKHMGMTTQIAP